MSNIIDKRIDRFIKRFDQKKFHVEKNDTLPSLKLSLPETYEEYLKGSFGRDTRNLMRRKIKRVEKVYPTKVTRSTKDTIKRDADILIKMWLDRWEKPELAKIDHEILLRFFPENKSWIYILWYEDIPIAGLSFLEDRSKSTIFAHLTAYDKAYGKISPGSVVFIYGIMNAIERGFKYFDFAQGLDPYKLMFKADKIDVFSVSITPKTLKGRLLKNFK